MDCLYIDNTSKAGVPLDKALAESFHGWYFDETVQAWVMPDGSVVHEIPAWSSDDAQATGLLAAWQQDRSVNRFSVMWLRSPELWSVTVVMATGENFNVPGTTFAHAVALATLCIADSKKTGETSGSGR